MPCLVPDFRGNGFNFSPLSIMFAVGLSHMVYIMLRITLPTKVHLVKVMVFPVVMYG